MSRSAASWATRTFVRGLVVVLPITVTAWALYWLATTAERVLGAGLRAALPGALYVPGMGVAAGIAVVFAIGVLMRLWLARQFVAWAERIVQRVPLVKTLYGSVRDMMGFFSRDGDDKSQLDQVVLVSLPDESTRLVGFLTRDDLPDTLGGDDRVAVYLPMSYQIGGFTVIVPRSRIAPTDLSVEDGMRFAMTAGLSTTVRGPASSTARRGEGR